MQLTHTPQDSRPSDREMAAVKEFQLDAGAQFHVMRDHRQHHALVLAGMWGAKWHGPEDAREASQARSREQLTSAVDGP